MRKGLIKFIVLTLVAAITAAVMLGLDRQGGMDVTSEMPEATLPLVYMKQDGIQINKLYGYRSQMDGTAVRDTITPISEGLTLPVVIKTYGKAIEGVSYEVRTMDMERLIQDGQVEEFSEESGELAFTLKFQNILEAEKEYMLALSLVFDEEPVYYYTRISQQSESHVKESVEFALDFHESTFGEGVSDSLATYLEPDSSGDNTTLQKVNIHSSLSQVCWAGFQGERMEIPIPSILEMSPYYNAVRLEYVLTSTGEHGELEYYNVEEYYRVRYNTMNNRMYLLGYERTMEQIFRGESQSVSQDKLVLGIRSDDVQFMQNEKGDAVAFVQAGELWSYQASSRKFTKIFSFRGLEGISDRENNGNHKIRIMKMDESGSVDFVVYGYMNRGSHEGQSGINVFHYDSAGNTIEELLFLPSGKSFQILDADWGSLFYVSAKDIFYLLAGDTLYGIDLKNRKPRRVVENLTQECYAVSEDGRYFAWQKDKQGQSLDVMDLEKEEIRSIEGKDGECLRPIGFVQSDFVYGAAKEEDIIEDVRFPMYQVMIADRDGNVVKEYQKDGYYITKAYVEKDTIFLNREMRAGAGFTSVDQDTIKSQELESAKGVETELFQSGEKQRQVRIALGAAGQEDAKTPRILAPREIVLGKPRDVALEEGKGQETYYVYGQGDVLLATNVIAEAVVCADGNRGVVIGPGQEYIWRRGWKTSQPAISTVTGEAAVEGQSAVSRCLSYLLKTEAVSADVDRLLAEGKTPKQILSETFTGYQILDLAGCTVEQMLYYVGQGTPVFAEIGDGAALIVGYDEHNTILYDPNTGETKKMGLQDSNTMFQAAGNRFLGYRK